MTGDDVEAPSRAAAGLAGVPAGLTALEASLSRLTAAGGALAGFAPFAASLLPLADGEHALCALPFALTVR